MQRRIMCAQAIWVCKRHLLQLQYCFHYNNNNNNKILITRHVALVLTLIRPKDNSPLNNILTHKQRHLNASREREREKEEKISQLGPCITYIDYATHTQSTCNALRFAIRANPSNIHYNHKDLSKKIIRNFAWARRRRRSKHIAFR